jgi:hypothetical protein
MSKRKSRIVWRYEKTNILSAIKSKHRFLTGGGGKKWWIWMMAVGFLFYFSVSSEAGMVYGRVLGVEGGVFTPGDTLAVYDSQNRKLQDVRTDSERGYSVLLPEGVFRVVYRDTWEAWIQSTPSAVRQDVYLKPKGK